MKIRKKEIAKKRLENFQGILEKIEDMYVGQTSTIATPLTIFIATVVLTPIITIIFINTTGMDIMKAIICSTVVAFICSLMVWLLLIVLPGIINAIIDKLFFKDNK